MFKSISLSAVFMILFTGCLEATPKASVQSVQQIEGNPTEEASAQISKNMTNSALVVAGGIFGGYSFNRLIGMFSGNTDDSSSSISENDENDFRENVRKILTNLFAETKTTSDQKITLLQPSSQFCSDIASGDAFDGCNEMIQHLSFRHQFTREHEGKIEAYFDQTEILSLEYSATSLRGSIFLSSLSPLFNGIRTAFSHHGVDTGLPTFSSAQGVIQVQASRDQNQIQLSYAATEAVSIKGVADKNHFHLDIAKDSFVGLIHDRSLSITQLAASIGEAKFTLKDFKLKIAQGFSGAFVFNDSARSVQVQALSVPGAGIVVKNNHRLLVSFNLQPLSANILFQEQGFTLELMSKLNARLSTRNGSIHLLGNRGSSLNITKDSPTFLENGTVSVQGAGEFENDLTIHAGDCFSGMPTSVVNCQ